MREIIIAIDGYSGTGKSSTAKKVAKKLNYIYIDSGAMYRAVTLFLKRENVNIEDLESVRAVLEKCEVSFDSEGIKLNGEYVEDKIRTMEVNEIVSQVSAISEVRSKLVAEQRRIGEKKGVVMDGRDIGTVVFPDAELKIFMTAEMKIRVLRRKEQLAARSIQDSEESIEQNLIHRDKIDTSREDSPLVKAIDAIEIDTSRLALIQQVEMIVQLANERR